jgi:nitric-oxide synthase, bacterial
MSDLSTLLGTVPFFSTLTPEECVNIAAQGSLVDFKPGEIILHEGDTGDLMYVIESGSVQVFTSSFDGSDMVLARLEAGRWFGEQALLPGGTGHRNASIRCLEACRLLTISRPLLESALSHNSELIKQMRARGEEQRAIRSSKFHEGALASLGLDASEGSSYRIETFNVGDVVFSEGDRGDRLYLILTGRAEVRRKEGASEIVLAELLPGQFFGEIAILKDTPRTATIVALDPLETVSLDGAWFRKAHEENPTLRALMDSLASMYLLPHRGLLTMQTGQLDGKPVLTSVHNLPSGRRVLSTKLLASDAFSAQVLGAPDSATKVSFEDRPRDIFRELQISDGHITRIVSEGEWTSLGEIFGMMLDDQPVQDWQLALFRERGNFQAQEIRPLYEESEIICTCTHTTCGRIMKAVRAGATTVEAVGQATGASRVCGGCKPLVRELLGQSDWTAARVVETIPQTDDIRSFRIRPMSGACRPYLPGQHLVIQARIDNRWIQRAYTISSASGSSEYEVTVKREPEGVFSRWLFERLQPDTVLRISEPGGDYYLPEAHTGDVVCLVGGIGVTPALAMARTLSRNGRPCRLYVDYSVSHDTEVVCREEIAGLSTPPRVSFNLRVTRRDGRFSLEQAKTMHQQYPDAIYFLCGSEPFMNGVAAQLRECGVPDDKIRIEVFSAAGERPAQATPRKGGCPVPHSAPKEAGADTPLEQARQILRNCYREAGAASAFEHRWLQVEEEIQKTGTYKQTYEELVYAARVAWRNSVKCIGRLFWQGLAVRDFRNIQTAAEMFDAIFSHLETAFNGGNIRPLMTVFAPNQKLRIWNQQIYRYAGYRMPDGSILGDPVDLELTDLALSLGWQPPAEKGRFDLLPVILSDGGEPVWREIPQNLRYEVIMRHPEYDWFESLGLKWYAMRVVALMILDAGGVQYTAAPFNGWSMETEIGARIYTDENRYNMLRVVAEKMGLDTSDDRSLWKDRALVELNVAVLYSYEKAGVKIMDHHNASQSFMKFDDLESQAGRQVYARWSWIVPPLSGSVTPVYHRDWPDVEIKPNFIAQPDPWKK